MLREIIISCFTVLSYPGDGPQAKPPLFAPLPSAPSPPVLPVVQPPGARRVDWTGVGESSFRLLGVMHGFRWLTEAGTRASGVGLGRGYSSSVLNLHGWADGDPFYVNYVGHPMQGAVAGRIWELNDPRYNKADFGRSGPYWKGRLRAAAFAWAFSEQFEIVTRERSFHRPHSTRFSAARFRAPRDHAHDRLFVDDCRGRVGPLRSAPDLRPHCEPVDTHSGSRLPQPGAQLRQPDGP